VELGLGVDDPGKIGFITEDEAGATFAAQVKAVLEKG
jgi:hypothetical protein